ncbi:ATP-binding protein [Sphingomonas psychrotolerans]|uniref:histidine kinase n=1 Tax=Sphingomonas psychrotolerans TaxID=1327635 RepID=A0ABU3N141_9SPHN|nr:ATP-binding protein [Sphingomonas psychrotolerans]MDT8758093.1 ATP-binding protein [Sphingomonas psychrotolerans]
MKPLVRAPLGLIGRIFAILLLAILIEFGASTFFYERASQLSVRDDEARRLAEHLVIARKLLAEHPAAERPALAVDLTTSRYKIAWSRDLPATAQVTPSLDRVHRQVIAWEPSLNATGLRLRLVGPARDAVIVGSTSLPDGSWMQFATREPVHDLSFSPERILLALAPAVAIILIGGVLVRQTLLPLRRLALATERVGAGTTQEVPEGGPREVRRVIHAFNRMQRRIHRLLTDRTQALAAVGHDLRTPLARLRLRADAIDDADVREEIETDIVEMQTMIDSLLAYLAGEANGEPRQAVDLAVICATIADAARDQGHDVDYAGPDHLERQLYPIAMKRALGNLVENGLHYGESVRILLEDRPDCALIRVEDDGPGIPEENIEQALQPFVRLDTARARDTVGFGLGLSIVSRAVEAEGGTLILSNRPKGGLRAEIRLPA